MKLLLFNKKVSQKTKIRLLLISLLIIIPFFILFQNISNFNELNYNTKKGIYNCYDLKSSDAYNCVVNLTNSNEINETRFHTGDIIPIKGEVYNETNPTQQFSGVDVSIRIDGDIYNQFNATTDSTGHFQINYEIQSFLNIYSSHEIGVKVMDDNLNPFYYHDYIIDVNTSSYFYSEGPSKPYFPGETTFNPNTYLRYDNGSGISNVDINYQWENSTDLWPESLGSTDSTGFLTAFAVPSNMSTGYYDLRLNFTMLPNKIDGSEAIISDIPIFSNISIEWNTPDKPYEGETITIKGQLYAKDDPTFKIYNRNVSIYYRASLIGTDTTDLNGNFSFSYTIPAGTGLSNIRVKLRENDMDSIYTVNVTTSPSNDPTIPPINVTPEQLFLVIGVPIIITASVIAAIAGYLVLKKRALESKVINIPLENKIKNLKLLKESGRIEEALSYLFSVIYMELISAKYGRKRKDNETIREFGIISVKEFGLDPAKIYPFIQNVEKFIYSRPSKISEKEFRNTVELFSPVYYQLTGTTFILNF